MESYFQTFSLYRNTWAEISKIREKMPWSQIYACTKKSVSGIVDFGYNRVLQRMYGPVRHRIDMRENFKRLN